MSKIMVPATCCKVGDIVAENTVVNQYIKNKFTELEIPCIWLYEPVELVNGLEYETKFIEKKETYKDVVLNLKGTLNELAAGYKIDYEKIVNVSNTIVSSINDGGYVIRCLAEIKDSDEYTYTHCTNVAFYSMLIAKWLDLSEFAIEEAIQAGLLHDIGKVKIPNEILNKKTKLTTGEF